MLAYIKGVLADIQADSIIIENGNMGYDIKVPLSVISNLPLIGTEVKIHTYLYVREDALSLYGFLSKDDLNVFKLLITVNGIGPKVACGILSAITPDDLRFAVMADDVKTIAKAPGIGKKTAQKLILDLRDKLKLEDVLTRQDENEVMPVSATDNKSEAILALVALGYSNTEAMKAVRQMKDIEELSVEEIIKGALKGLSGF